MTRCFFFNVAPDETGYKKKKNGRDNAGVTFFLCHYRTRVPCKTPIASLPLSCARGSETQTDLDERAGVATFLRNRDRDRNLGALCRSAYE